MNKDNINQNRKLDKIHTYESFISKWFKKKKKPFLPDTSSDEYGERSRRGFTIPHPELESYISDILIELGDVYCKWNIDQRKTSTGKYKLVIDIIKDWSQHDSSQRSGYDLSFNSNDMVNILYHLESYLSKEWNMKLYEIMVVYPLNNRRMHEYYRTIEEFEMIDTDVYEVSIEFTIN